jgi:hypothetical protein
MKAPLSMGLVIVFSLLPLACAKPQAKPVAASAVAPLPPPRAQHLHLPGIGGYRSIDRMFLQGLEQGGIDAEVRAYDWTVRDTGLGALLTSDLHKEETAKVAAMLTELARKDPRARVTASAHSGGAGIVVWALESLPDDVTIDSLLLLSPALSPPYDLTRALKHVRNKVYVFYSPYDVAVLGVGTQMLGTIDGVKSDAAGRVGFKRPDGADQIQYAKLVQVPYDPAWMQLGNIGEHIGTLARPFAREVVAPLILTGVLPRIEQADDPLKTPATLPSAGDAAPAATTTPAVPTPPR